MVATQQLFFCYLLVFSIWIYLIYAVTNSQDAAELRSLKNESGNTQSYERKTLSKGVIAGVASGCSVLILLIAVIVIYVLHKKRHAERDKAITTWPTKGTETGKTPQLKGARRFSYDELKKCTNNFSESNQIGSGGYGKVHRGMLLGGQVIAVKRSEQGSIQFNTEIELLPRVNHKNLVGLVGFCFEQGEQMLVYEFMANGTLRKSLSGRSGIRLDWTTRIQIALDSFRGLAYLHELAPPIIHRDVNSTNIFLDKNMTAKVTGFGLSKLVCDTSKGHVSTEVKGTPGYIDPEYYMTQQLTVKSNVYSFGVVMLELITGRQPIKEGKYIVQEVRMAMDKNDETHHGLMVRMDPIIGNTPHLIGFLRFIDLAMKCVEGSTLEHPTTSEIVKSLETILQNEGKSTSAFLSAAESEHGVGSLKTSL